MTRSLDFALSLALSAAAAAAFTVAAPAHACPTHDVTVPTGAGNGAPREVKELLDTPFVKLVSITLRKGTVLAKHSAKDAVTLQAISGSGKVKVGTTTDSLAPGHVVLVAPGAEHEVIPDGTADLVVLVHFLKLGGASAAAAHGEAQGAKGGAGHSCEAGCEHKGAKGGAGHSCEAGCEHKGAKDAGGHGH